MADDNKWVLKGFPLARCGSGDDKDVSGTEYKGCTPLYDNSWQSYKFDGSDNFKVCLFADPDCAKPTVDSSLGDKKLTCRDISHDTAQAYSVTDKSTPCHKPQ